MVRLSCLRAAALWVPSLELVKQASAYLECARSEKIRVRQNHVCRSHPNIEGRRR